MKPHFLVLGALCLAQGGARRAPAPRRSPRSKPAYGGTPRPAADLAGRKRRREAAPSADRLLRRRRPRGFDRMRAGRWRNSAHFDDHDRAGQGGGRCRRRRGLRGGRRRGAQGAGALTGLISRGRSARNRAVPRRCSCRPRDGAAIRSSATSRRAAARDHDDGRDRLAACGSSSDWGSSSSAMPPSCPRRVCRVQWTAARRSPKAEPRGG